MPAEDVVPASTRPTMSRLVDAGLCAVVLAIAAVRLIRGEVTAIDIAATASGIGLIPLRRRWPVFALGAGLAGAVVTVAIAGEPTELLPVTVVLIFNVARRTDRTGAIAAGLGGLAALMTCVLILGPDDIVGPEILAGMAWPVLAAAAGDAVRSRAEVIAGALERVERAERERDEIARRQVIEERLRIARDLHDVVAHNIAVVNVQAGVAEHLLRTNPDAAAAALGHVSGAAQVVLDELAGILSVLRADSDTRPATEPVPKLDAVPALVNTFAASGLDITYETSGAQRTIGEAASIAAYRMIQEALTNANKHGDGHAHLRVDSTPQHLRVTVTNRVASASLTPAAPTSGYGLVGMRERVSATGGTLTVGKRPDGSFVVDATFPFAAQRAPGQETA